MSRTPSIRRRRASVRLAAFAIGLAALFGATASGGVAQASADERDYVVVLSAAGKNTGTLEDELGFDAELRFRHALRGFAAELTPAQVQELRADPAVELVTPDRPVSADALVGLKPGEPTPPPGIRRILAGTTTAVREASTTAVAVLDTGIDLSHPDLNAAAGPNCNAPGTAPTDDNGHGTHVAGTIAAKNNGAGVTGVAPGTKVYAVKVLDDKGKGSLASVVCGIDWVAANRAALNIGVANMSLGGYGPAVRDCASATDPEHRAICRATAAGATFVVSAGNDAKRFDDPTTPYLPAAYPQVLAVTAMTDTDGKPGGKGSAPCRAGEKDDTPAGYSSFAASAASQARTVAAPGTCVRSTTPNGKYGTGSGTSMAAPHAAGAVALCIGEGGKPGECAGKAPGQIVSHMASSAQSRSLADRLFGFLRDPLSSPLAGVFFGYLVGAPATTPAAQPPPSSPTAPATPRRATLRVTKATVRGRGPHARLIVQGRFDPAAAGERLTVRFRAARRGTPFRVRVQRDGRFAEMRMLRGKQRRARSGRLTVRYPGSDVLRPAKDRARAR